MDMIPVDGIGPAEHEQNVANFLRKARIRPSTLAITDTPPQEVPSGLRIAANSDINTEPYSLEDQVTDQAWLIGLVRNVRARGHDIDRGLTALYRYRVEADAYSEIGEDIGVSRERVRQLEKATIKKIQKRAQIEDVRAFPVRTSQDLLTELQGTNNETGQETDATENNTSESTPASHPDGQSPDSTQGEQLRRSMRQTKVTITHEVALSGYAISDLIGLEEFKAYKFAAAKVQLQDELERIATKLLGPNYKLHTDRTNSED